jgi:hypothetical protein
MLPGTRRTALGLAAAAMVPGSMKAPIVDSPEHAWVAAAVKQETATCPTDFPSYD